MGISSAFFRFYFDSDDPSERRVVLRTSFWFTMAMATAGLVVGLVFAEPISSALFDSSGARTSCEQRSSVCGRR